MKKQNEKQNISGEETTIKNSPVQGAASPESKSSAKPGKKGSAWKSVLVGGIPGIIFGVAGTLATEDVAAAATVSDDNDIETPSGSAPVFETAHEATSVNDDMSFNDAFAAARAEVGAGGVFSWHGQVFSTYLKQEWDGLNNEQRHDFSQSVTNANIHPDPYTPQPHDPPIEPNDPPVGTDDPNPGDDPEPLPADDPNPGDDPEPLGPADDPNPGDEPAPLGPADDPNPGDDTEPEPDPIEDPNGVHIIGSEPGDGINNIDDGGIDNHDPFINVDPDGHVLLEPDDVGFDAPDDNLFNDMPDYTNDADASSLI